jgi:hypothetical protein
MWHYATATSESIFYNGCYPGDGYFGPQCYWNGTNLIYRVNTFYGPIDTGIYSINTWHMFTVEYDGTTLKIYIDGVYAAGSNRNLNQTGARTGIAFSNLVDNTGVNGLALINVYNVAIGSGNIATLYANQKNRFQVVASYDLNNLSSYPGTGSTVYDLSFNGKNLTLSNTTYYDGVNYNSLVFNAASPSYANYNGSLGVPTGPPVFSFFMWIKTTSFTANPYDIFFSYGRDGNPSIGGIPLICSRAFGSNVAYAEFGSGKAPIAPATPTVLDEWTNYCITSDGTTYKFYIDGALVGSAALSGSDIWTSPQLTIGALQVTGDFPCNLEFNYLDVYDIALTAGEITTLYNDTVSRFTPTPVTPTLIGSYDFSDPACWPGSGNTAYDLTAENNDLQLNIISFGGTGQSKYASLNGDTSWMYKGQFSASGSTFNSDEFTISLWHNYNTQSTFGGVSYIAMGGVTASGQGPSIVVDNSDQKVRGVFGAEITAGGWVTGIANTVNTWHMTTLVADGTDFLLYQDGALTGSTTQAGQWGGSNLVFGRPSQFPTGPADGLFGHKWGGLLGIAEVYSGALGSTDVSDLYDLQSPRFITIPPYAGNVGGRQFGQGFNG